MENATGKPLKDYRPIEQRMWHFMEEEIGKKIMSEHLTKELSENLSCDVLSNLRQLAPHMMQREGVVLLKDAREEIYRLREAIMVQLGETEDSEYMTGAQRVQFARDALTPNA